MTTLRWFSSHSVRHAGAMCKHVRKLLNHQRDILAPKDADEINASIASVEKAIDAGADKAGIERQADQLEKTANKRLRPYPYATWRENIEVLLVALTVAMGIRTFFLQPFKIPTGSMQPTLFGVESQNLRNDPDFKAPTGWARVKEWFGGVSYVRVTAKKDGQVELIGPMFRVLIFNIYQSITLAGDRYSMWFPPDYGSEPLESPRRANLRSVLNPSGEGFFRKGEDIVNLQVKAGDHLFVDRLTYNFRKPDRGEIIVFETKGIRALPQDQFYIKRLVALAGEQVRIGNDRHLVIDGKRLDASTPHFENVYTFDPGKPPRRNQYSGHVNQETAAMTGQAFDMRYFPDETAVYTVPKGQLLAMGDNTMDSYDSRCWGGVPSTNVIGRGFFVYWPITKRFGPACLVQ